MTDQADDDRARTMIEVAAAALKHMPPAVRFTAEDGEVLRGHRDLLVSLESQVVASFYDTLYAHPPTAAVFTEGERPDREETLAQWWRKTIDGPLDDQYFAWMALVGLVHVARGVENPAMLAMGEHVVDLLAVVLDDPAVTASAGLSPTDAERLLDAFRRLTTTVGAIITFGYTYGYDEAVGAALYDIAGMPERLVRRLREQQIATAVERGRQQLDGVRPT